eukprot:scaffold19891_cov84-Phaeocystis_antarctica.AAC.4
MGVRRPVAGSSVAPSNRSMALLMPAPVCLGEGDGKRPPQSRRHGDALRDGVACPVQSAPSAPLAPALLRMICTSMSLQTRQNSSTM